MSESCGICEDPIPSTDDFVKCSTCHQKYHFECAEVEEKQWKRYGEKRRNGWKCKECKSSGKSTDKPVTSEVNDLNTEVLKKIEETIQAQFAKQSTKFNERLDQFQTSVDFCSQKIDDYESQIKALLTKLSSFEKENLALKAENLKLSTEVKSCRLQLEELEQYNRNRNVQIEGVPEIESENMQNIVNTLAHVIDVPIDFSTDVQAVHRVPTKRSKGPKPIILQFSNRQKRDLFLKNSKGTTIKSTDFIANAPKTNVFVNQHLTPFNKYLLFNARKLKDLKQYKYIWPSEGRIFVRKSDSDKKQRISSISDINKLAGCDVEQVNMQGQGGDGR